MIVTFEGALIPVPSNWVPTLLEGKEAEDFLRDMNAGSIDHELLMHNSQRRAEILRKLGIDDDHGECLLYISRVVRHDDGSRISFDLFVRAAEHLCGSVAMPLPEKVSR